MMDGRIGSPMQLDGCNFDWLVLDSPGTPLGDFTGVGFVPSRKLRHAIEGKLSWGGASCIMLNRK